MTATETLHGLDAPPPDLEPAPGWHQSLGRGTPGVLLYHVVNARHGTGSWNTVRAHAEAMTSASVEVHDVQGLYQGLPALAYAVAVAAHPDFALAQQELDARIDPFVRRRLTAAYTRMDAGLLPEQHEWDVIGGLTGLGAYLLHARQPGDAALQEVLAYLVRLTDPVITNYGQRPGWWVSTGPKGKRTTRWPGGHGNTGIAHGITGPLLLLANAALRGTRVPRQDTAMGVILDWLDQIQRDKGRRAHWPQWISLREHSGFTTPQDTMIGRPGWCYGTPGIALAQQRAALALDDPDRLRRAELALLGCFADPHQLDRLDNPGLCHGWAGTVRIAQYAAETVGDDSELAALVPHLRTRFNERCRRGPHNLALLEGCAGIELARTTSITHDGPGIPWDACLLLPY